MFNLPTKDDYCYWCDEHNAYLVASVFAPCVFDCLKKLLRETLCIIIEWFYKTQTLYVMSVQRRNNSKEKRK